jgi:hypothetical protein
LLNPERHTGDGRTCTIDLNARAREAIEWSRGGNGLQIDPYNENDIDWQLDDVG